MRNRIATTLGTGAIVTTILALGITTAQAALTWTVTNGGPALAFNQAGSATLKDVNSGTVLTDTGGSATVDITSGHHGSGTRLRYSSGTGLGTISFGGGNGGCLPPPLVLCPPPPWLIEAVSYNSGITTGTISGSATLNTTNAAGSCTATVSGAADASYSNSSHTITISPDASQLSLSAVSGDGCSMEGLANGDVLDFNAAFVESSGPYLRITSP